MRTDIHFMLKMSIIKWSSIEDQRIEPPISYCTCEELS